MTKIIEVNNCMECTLSFRRLDAKLHCSKYFEKIIPETIFDNDPPDAPIPDWCPLENKAIGTVSLADIEKNCERIDSEARADERKKVYTEILDIAENYDRVYICMTLRSRLSQSPEGEKKWKET